MAEKNQLTTGTLTWEDQQNNADYKANASGTNIQGTSIDGKIHGGITPVRTQNVKDHAESTTKAGVAEGVITITDKENQKQDIGTLNRDTKNSLNKLAQIFDKDDVKEKQEFIGMFSTYAYKKVGDIASEQGWAPDDPRRAGLHALVGGLVSGMAGGNAWAGAAGAGTMERLQPILDEYMKNHPDMREWAAILVGSAVGKLSGDTNAGASNALSGTKYNWLSHEQQMERDKLIAEAEARGDYEAAEQIRVYYENLDEEQDRTKDKFGWSSREEFSPESEQAIINGTQVYREYPDEAKTVLINGIRLAKQEGLTGYHFNGEDYVVLNIAAGSKFGVSGTLIMDRMGNVYLTAGGGLVTGLSGTMATGKFKEDTSEWTAEIFIDRMTGASVSSGLGGWGATGSVNISASGASREIGVSGWGLSAVLTGNKTIYLCNINTI